MSLIVVSASNAANANNNGNANNNTASNANYVAAINLLRNPRPIGAQASAHGQQEEDKERRTFRI